MLQGLDQIDFHHISVLRDLLEWYILQLENWITAEQIDVNRIKYTSPYQSMKHIPYLQIT